MEAACVAAAAEAVAVVQKHEALEGALAVSCADYGPVGEAEEEAQAKGTSLGIYAKVRALFTTSSFDPRRTQLEVVEAAAAGRCAVVGDGPGRGHCRPGVRLCSGISGRRSGLYFKRG
jgi:hypothetical protein